MVDEEVKTVDLIAQAQAAAERLEKANMKHEELLKNMTLLESRKILGGKSQAGEPEPEKKEETPSEYAKRMLRGGV